MYNRISTGHEDNYNYILYVEKIEIWKIHYKKTQNELLQMKTTLCEIKFFWEKKKLDEINIRLDTAEEILMNLKT